MVVESGGFSANNVRLTACRAGDIVVDSEKSGLDFLYARCLSADNAYPRVHRQACLRVEQWARYPDTRREHS